MTYDYKRHGTTTLFAALNLLDGRVIGRCMQRHQHEEFIRFLNAVERDLPAGKLVKAVVDTYATHKHPKVREWLARHPRWTFYFTLTTSSWLNAVDAFFFHAYPQAHPSRQFPIDRRSASRHQPLSRRTQCRAQVLPLEGLHRLDPRQAQHTASSVRMSQNARWSRT
jgi:hypothetical protein